MNHEEIITGLEDYVIALKKLHSEKTSLQVADDELERVKILARKLVLKKHILANSSEVVRDLYITALIAVFGEELSKEAKEYQMLHVGKIIASYDKTIDFKRYMTKCLKIDNKFWNNFSEMITDSLAVCFVVDVLLIYNNACKDDRKILKNITNVFELLDFDNTMLRKVIGIVKCILEDKFYDLLEVVQYKDGINYTGFISYFSDVEYDCICSDLFMCDYKKGKSIVVNYKLENHRSRINFDLYLGEGSTLYKCDFTNIDGVVASNNLNFLHSVFKNSKCSHNLIELSNAYVKNCLFEKCVCIDMKGEALVKFNNSKVCDCKFMGCSLETACYDEVVTGAVCEIHNSSMKNTIFDSCVVKGNGTRSYAGNEFMSILQAQVSDIKGCKFIACSYHNHSYLGRYGSSIVNIENTTFDKLDFKKCWYENHVNKLGALSLVKDRKRCQSILEE